MSFVGRKVEVIEAAEVALRLVGQEGRLWRSGRGCVRIQNDELMNQSMTLQSPGWV